MYFFLFSLLLIDLYENNSGIFSDISTCITKVGYGRIDEISDRYR